MSQSPLRVPPALAELRQSRIDLVGVASVEGGEMARYLLAAGFTNLVGNDQQPDLVSLRRAHHLAHAGLNREERRQRLDQLLEGLHSLQLADAYLQGVQQSTMVIPSQAWFLSPANSALHRLREQGHPFYSLIQAYLDLAQGEVVGITGTHGKSTTSALVAAVLGQSGLYPTVWLAGNDRHDRQALEEVARDDRGGCLVLEISNRQLLQMERAPRVGCLTNITPNHLDEHQGLAGYLRTKRRIFELPGCEVAIRNGDDPLSFEGNEPHPGIRQLRFALHESRLEGFDGAYEEDGMLQLRWQTTTMAVMPADRVPLVGSHNRSNVRAALTVLAALAPPDPSRLAAAARAIGNFRPLRHRTELTRRHQGVDYFDDLSSTTPQSTVAAIRGLARPCILIAGGDDKGIEFTQLSGLVGGPVRAVVLLPGAGSERLARELTAAGEGALVHRVEKLQAAVELAAELARPGEAVLLSPACPGFFSAHYGEGGFRQAVRRATSPRPRREPE
ncbi:MAG TPA: Mur ligase family protein [Candidatus Dormibacteraeota bacterium]|nr:Mur ligase family protein [Candidatus Dormibacteraeota bacterium]